MDAAYDGSEVKRTFGTGDYAVFGVVLGVSSIVGIYYAFQAARRKSSDTEGYNLAHRKMHAIPVALSLTVSFMSAITILGTPAEIYANGLMFWWLLPSFLIAAFVISEIYIPIFYRLKITSSYEYLELRFNRVVRIMATVAFIVETIMYVGIVIYAPALALSEVTGFNLWAAVLSTGIVCTFYTTLGGLKGVIWTDVFQSFVMISGLLAVIIQGSVRLGGFSNIWDLAGEGGRLRMNIVSPDPRVKHSLWTLLVGGSFVWLGMYAVSQSQVQRYLSCRTERHSKLALYLNFFGLGVIMSFACMCGLVMYAYYRDCDPISNKKISSPDRILPFLVMDILGEYPGIPGIFVACVYSGSLSTVSTGINAMACVTVEDFVKPCTNFSKSTYGWLSRGFGIVFGIASIGMAYLASALGGVLQAALSIFGIVGGPLIGIFTLGMIFPFAESWGAVAGLIMGLFSTSWLYIGATQVGRQAAILNPLPFSKSGCTANQSFILNETTASTTLMTTGLPTTFAKTTPYPDIVNFYSISYLYYSCVGFVFTVFFGIVVSLVLGGYKNVSSIDPRLIFPVFEHWTLRWLPLSFRKMMLCGVRYDKQREDMNSPLNLSSDVKATPSTRTETDAPKSPEYNAGQPETKEYSAEINGNAVKQDQRMDNII